MEARTDDELVKDYLGGDEGAFSVLVHRHTDGAYRLAHQMIRSDEASDVVQDAWVKAWKNIKKFELGKNFRTWLLTIVRNTTLDHLRKKQAVAFSSFDTDDNENVLTATLAADDISALEHSILAEDRARVREMLDTLSPAYRVVLELRYGEELQFEEIGAVLGRPMNTVKSQARRALIELKKRLGDNEHQNPEK